VIRLYVLIVVVGLVGGAIGGAWYYVTSTQERIETLIANDVKLRMAKQVLDDTINTLVADQKKFAKLNSDLRANLDKANDYKDVLIGKLRKHDLSRLSLKKPLLVEKRINAATAKLFKSLEALSGATPPAK
jgi:peptidoglycan hydrolase CwlO-like protein